MVLLSRSPDRLEAARKELGAASDRLSVRSVDLGNWQAAAEAIDEIESDFGPIDVLVNSAGAAKRSSPDELSPAVYREAMDAKFFTYINAIDPVLKKMAPRGSGVIINIIGSGGKTAMPSHIAGGAANSALMLVTAGLGKAYAGQEFGWWASIRAEPSPAGSRKGWRLRPESRASRSNRLGAWPRRRSRWDGLPPRRKSPAWRCLPLPRPHRI